MAYNDGFGGFSYGENFANNQKRYQDTLAGYQNSANQFAQGTQNIQGQFTNMLGGIAGIGHAAMTALGQQYARSGADIQQGLVSKGLGNSTLLENAKMGNNYQLANAQTGLENTLQQQRLGVQQAQAQAAMQGQAGLAGIQGASLGYQGQNQLAGQGIEAQYGLQQAQMHQQQQNQLEQMRQQAGLNVYQGSQAATGYGMGQLSGGMSNPAPGTNNGGGSVYQPSYGGGSSGYGDEYG